MNFAKTVIVGFFLIFLSQKASAQNPINWKSEDLLEPKELSATIKSDKNIPLIFSIGPGAIILIQKI